MHKMNYEMQFNRHCTIIPTRAHKLCPSFLNFCNVNVYLGKTFLLQNFISVREIKHIYTFMIVFPKCLFTHLSFWSRY